MPKSPVLTMSVSTLLLRIAWLEANGHPIEAKTLRDLAAWFTPPYRVDEAAVQGYIAEMIAARDKPRRLD